MKVETVEEFLKRGGKITKAPAPPSVKDIKVNQELREAKGMQR